jgi:hypothetical protein
MALASSGRDMSSADADRSARLLTGLIFVQLHVAAWLAFAAPQSYQVGMGILFGQATLLGIWLAAARTGSREADIAAALEGVLLTLGVGNLGGGWGLILLIARAVVAAGYYRWKFVRRGIRLAVHGQPTTENLLRIPLYAFFIGSLLVALFLSIGLLLSGGAVRVWAMLVDPLLVVLVILLGVGYAAMSTLTSLAPLEPRPTGAKFAAYSVVIVGFAAAFGGVAYWQTSQTGAAVAFALTALLECLWVLGSLAVARGFGLRLRFADTTTMQASSPGRTADQ